MKSNLDLLIDHFQNECDYLKSEIKACINEADFSEAEAIQRALDYTSQKLRILENLKNPHTRKINHLKRILDQNEPTDYDSSNLDHLDELVKESLLAFRKKRYEERQQSFKAKLEKLESLSPRLDIDDDKFLTLIDQFKRNDIHTICLELIEDSVRWEMKAINQNAILSIHSLQNKELDYYFHKGNKNILKNLGYSETNCEKPVGRTFEINEFDILTDISIIAFELF